MGYAWRAQPCYYPYSLNFLTAPALECLFPMRGGGGMTYMGYIGMCRCEGYGFEAVYCRIEYINQSIWV